MLRPTTAASFTATPPLPSNKVPRQSKTSTTTPPPPTTTPLPNSSSEYSSTRRRSESTSCRFKMQNRAPIKKISYPPKHSRASPTETENRNNQQTRRQRGPRMLLLKRGRAERERERQTLLRDVTRMKEGSSEASRAYLFTNAGLN